MTSISEGQSLRVIPAHAQAIEHAEKVLSLAEFFLQQPNHPLAIKALQRRAAARTCEDKTSPRTAAT